LFTVQSRIATIMETCQNYRPVLFKNRRWAKFWIFGTGSVITDHLPVSIWALSGTVQEPLVQDSGEVERLTLKDGFAFMLFKEDKSVELACRSSRLIHIFYFPDPNFLSLWFRIRYPVYTGTSRIFKITEIPAPVNNCTGTAC